MKSLYLPVFIAVVLSFACGCWEDVSQESVEKPIAAERTKDSGRRIAEPKILPKKSVAEEQPVVETQPEPVAEAQPTEAQPQAKKPKMSTDERKALREQRREEFRRQVEARRNKTPEQRAQEHKEAMQRATEKRILQEERLKLILEKRAKQQQQQ